jgi:hypothetical protein
MNYLERISSFTLSDLPNLDEVTLAALQLLDSVDVPKIDISMYKNPLVVGSGNAELSLRQRVILNKSLKILQISTAWL